MYPRRELKAEKDYGGIIVSARCDRLHGMTIADDKSTSHFSGDAGVEKYIDKKQWRYYLDIFGANEFVWHIWRLGKSSSRRRTIPVSRQRGKCLLITSSETIAIRNWKRSVGTLPSTSKILQTCQPLRLIRCWSRLLSSSPCSGARPGVSRRQQSSTDPRWRTVTRVCGSHRGKTG